MLDHAVKGRAGLFVDLTGIVHFQNHLAGIPVGKEICTDGKNQRQQHTGFTAQ
ncbi:MAG: hypothetical protein L3J05_06800 [Robiginitomaculum sp.]|nr:hypothetical protein [Robiginitomaculum sp.]